jgi:hypothetical protein
VLFDTIIDLDLNSPPPRLQRVKLEGNLKKLPEWISKLQNLVKLKVTITKEGNDAMKLLQSMPNLLSLHISSSSSDDNLERLHFQDGWFKNLKELHLSRFCNLSDILIDEGALGSLKKLTLGIIPQLRTLPTGILLCIIVTSATLYLLIVFFMFVLCTLFCCILFFIIVCFGSNIFLSLKFAECKFYIWS